VITLLINCCAGLAVLYDKHVDRRSGMTPEEARQIIEVLANGIDPATGEVMPDHGPLGSPHVIRALFLAAKALEQVSSKAARSAATPGQAGKSWSEDEDQRLVAAFDAGTPVAALARAHDRSAGAITSRLIRLGRLQVSNKTAPG
jgi:hypothetical protein